MALTSTQQYFDITADSEFYSDILAAGDSSYPTGGYAVSAALFGLNTFKPGKLTQVPPAVPYSLVGDNAAAHSWFAVVNPSTGNLQLFEVSATTSTSATLSELPAATNVSAYTAHLVARGN